LLASLRVGMIRVSRLLVRALSEVFCSGLMMR